ncbi:endolytic transglycosylase MltG, partial [Kitasatospora kazusensis]
QQGQQQIPQQQGFPQQQPMQQQPPQALRNPGMPMRPQPPAQAQPPARPAGPGPDGIDWEAEAAALDGPRAEPEPEAWHEDEQDEEYGEHTEADEYADHEAEAEQESFFGAGEQDTSREAERKRKEKGKASGRRNSGACLVVALALVGGVAGAGWWGYGFYQSHFGPPPDYKGSGTGSVSVEIKAGSGEQMGATLQASDVVKSVKAFVAAFTNNSKAGSIQPGSYTLHHQMSAEAAVQELVDSNGGNALVIPEGKKAVDIYTMIDNKLKLQKGATAAAAASQISTLGLPDYAQGNLEGFLFPARYSVTDGMKPEAMLKQMVAMAVQHYQQLNLDDGAKKIGLTNGYQVIIEASILQAEGNNDTDFGKIARVLSNRLNTQATQGKLQLDTTLQYKLGRTNFTKAEKDGDKSPYNTYYSKGLPPTPISNPGDAAIQAVLNPTPGDWVYFVAVSPTDTRFEKTFDDFKTDVKAYCTAHNQGFDPSGMCK